MIKYKFEELDELEVQPQPAPLAPFLGHGLFPVWTEAQESGDGEVENRPRMYFCL